MEVDTRFKDILVSSEFKEYTDYCMIVRGKPFLIKFPVGVENTRYYHALANSKVFYKLEHTSPPKKRGRKKKYVDRSEANHAYYERRKSRIAQTVA